jgi:response regulator RpfG family c-di-GMP phosphodiesterase
MTAHSHSTEGCVLIVDDQEDIRETLREVIEMAGCRTLSAANGVEALALLEHHRPCLIVLDLLMPVMGGQEVLAVMRSRPELASLPVVVSTSAPHLAPRGVPILPKPIEIVTLWGWMKRTCHCAAAHPLPDRKGAPV